MQVNDTSRDSKLNDMKAVRRWKLFSYNAYILSLLMITAITAWNAHNVALSVRSECFPDRCKRQIAHFFPIGMYKNVTKPVSEI